MSRRGGMQLVVSQGLSQALALAASFAVITLLPTADLGLWGLAAAVAGYAGYADLGMVMWSSRTVAAWHASENREALAEALARVVFRRCLTQCALVLCAAAVVLAGALGLGLSVRDAATLFLACAAGALGSLAHVRRAQERSLHHHARFAKWNLAMEGGGAAARIAGTPAGPIGMVAAWSLTMLGLAVAGRPRPAMGVPLPTAPLPPWQERAAATLLMLALAIMLTLPRWVGEALLDRTSLGFLTAGMVVISLAMSIAGSINTLLVPVLAEASHAPADGEAPRLYLLASAVTSAVGLASALGATVLLPALLPRYAPTADCIGFLSGASVCLSTIGLHAMARATGCRGAPYALRRLGIGLLLLLAVMAAVATQDRTIAGVAKGTLLGSMACAAADILLWSEATIGRRILLAITCLAGATIAGWGCAWVATAGAPVKLAIAGAAAGLAAGLALRLMRAAHRARSRPAIVLPGCG